LIHLKDPLKALKGIAKGENKSPSPIHQAWLTYMEDKERVDKKVFNKRYALVKSLDVKYLIASIFKAQISFFLWQRLLYQL